MGGTNKLLHPVRGVQMLEHTLRTIAGLGLAETIVVTGRDDVLVAQLAQRHGARPVHNPDYTNGMGTSLSVGARALGAGHGGVFVHLGDVPFVSAQTWKALAAAAHADAVCAFDVFVPACDGRRGHPVLFRRDLIGPLSRLSGDVGARNLIAAHACREIDVTDPMIAHDIDTPADLE